MRKPSSEESEWLTTAMLYNMRAIRSILSKDQLSVLD